MRHSSIRPARTEKEAETLIETENLNVEAAKRYITTSLKREYASENGTDLNDILPKMSPLNPQYKTKNRRFSKNRGVCGEV